MGSSSGAGRTERAEGLYDVYLDACLEGRCEPADEFLTRHGVEDADLLQRLQALEALARAETEPASTETVDLACEPAAAGLPYERLGSYRLLRRVAEGGMGTVYLAEHEALRRRVAIKVIRPELVASPTSQKRFEREARTIARLRHPAVVEVYDTGEDHGVRYIAMAWVPGRPLGEVARAERPAVERVLRWGGALARALAHAHEHGIVHRDVKPSNVLVTPDDRPVLIDFGIAHLADAEITRLTHTFAGSPAYAAPEQVSSPSPDIDGRVDVYGLGATLYEALAGEPPFGDGAMAQVLRRVLVEEPQPLRLRRPDLDPAVALVVAKAMEKRPRDRYPTAAAFAEDLEALAARRPVSARPPRIAARLAKWARRRPVHFTVVASVVVAALLAGGIALWRIAEAAAERRTEARRLVADAFAQVEAYRARRLARAENDARLGSLRKHVSNAYLEDAELAEHARLEREELHRGHDVERVFHGVLDLVGQAERLDPTVPRAHEVRARLYLERGEEARTRGDAPTADFYEALVKRHDEGGTLTAGRARRTKVVLECEAEGTEVHLFRCVEAARLRPDGESRLVPVPMSGELPAPAGAWALRIVAAVPPFLPGDLVLSLRGRAVTAGLFALRERDGLRRGDRLVAVNGKPVLTRLDLRGLARDAEHALNLERTDAGPLALHQRVDPADFGDFAALALLGGETAVTFREGRARTEPLPSALDLRITAAPLFVSHASRLGVSPIDVEPLEPGRYQLLFRSEGHEDLTYCFYVEGEPETGVTVRLLPPGRTPAGFVRVQHGPQAHAWCWIMEREVTCGEYVEFLADPAVRAEIAASPVPIRFPRGPIDKASGGIWTRTADGGFAVPPDFGPEFPVLGVSFEDARAYAAWRSRRDGRAYAVPNRHEWTRAAGGQGHRRYPFGDAFSPRWVKSCFSRPQAYPEVVFSYPVDESPFGAFDMSGSASEWLDDWFDEGRGLRRIGGLNWAVSDPVGFGIWGGHGMEPDVAVHTVGIRLVLRPEHGK